MANNDILYKKSQKKAEMLKELSPHLFWNIDVSKLDIKKNKKTIIERIIEYGLDNDEIILWKLYNYFTIKKVAVNMDSLPYLRIKYYSFVLNLKENKFKCYKNKSYLWN
jgi:hypothetical protein